MKKKQGTILSIATFLIVSIILSGLYMLVLKKSVAESRERYRYIAVNQSNIIRDSIDAVLARSFTLSTLVHDNDGGTAFFDRQAERIYQETKKDTGITLKNIAVAPGGIVEKAYPVAGNEALIGFDFMDETKPGNQEAIAAYQRGELVITNPFHLVQGGVGLAGRLPVFLDNDGKTDFWGLVTVTMDFDEMLGTIDLINLTNMGIDYELWYKNTDGERVTLSTSDQKPQNPVSYEIALRNLNWYFDVSPSNGWVDDSEAVIVFCIIFSLALLIALLLVNRGQIKRANEELRRLAHLDSLTSCYSRHYVNTVLLDQRDGSWNDPDARYSLVIIDIDNFKSINDTYGHDVGDRALIAISRVLEDNSKHSNGDCVIRHGGDEFIILFNDVTRARFIKKLDSILNDVRKIHFPDIKDIHFTVSMGGDYYISPEESTYYKMVHRADEKLYQAKESGRDQYAL